MTLRYLIEKEFKQMVRNPMIPRLIVIFPCLMILIMPWAANLEIRNVNVSIADGDHSTLSMRLTDKMVASDYFRLADIAPDYGQAMRSIERGDADMIVEIPPGFEADLMRGMRPQVLIAANSVNGTKGALSVSYMSAILEEFSSELRQQYASLAVQGPAQPQPSFGVHVQGLFNPHMDYKLFMVPALMVMLLTMLCGFLPALNIVSEKELGTIEQINVTPVSKFTFILGKLIPYWIVGFVVLFVCVPMAWIVYGFLPVGSMWTIMLFTMAFLLVMSGLGVLISNNSGTMQQAMFLMFFFVIVFLMMSGLFTPIEGMPEWAQMIAQANPLTYFIAVMRAVYIKGSAVADLLPELAALCGFALLFNVWAVWSYRKSGA